MSAGGELGVQLGGSLQKAPQARGVSPVFLAGLFHDSRPDEILKFFVSPQTQHFLSAPGRVAITEIRVDDVEKSFELERGFFGKHCCQFLSDAIWPASGKAVSSFHRRIMRIFGQKSSADASNRPEIAFPADFRPTGNLDHEQRVPTASTA